VSELNPRNRSLFHQKANDPGQWLHLIILPDAHVLRRDPATRRYRRSLGQGEAHAAQSPGAEVN